MIDKGLTGSEGKAKKMAKELEAFEEFAVEKIQ